MGVEWSSLLWFGVIVVAIPFALWFIKRTPLGQSGSAGAPRVVSVLPLSATQRVVTVEVGRGEHRIWMVLGVTPQSITNLSSMAPQEDPSAAAPASPAEAFAP